MKFETFRDTYKDMDVAVDSTTSYSMREILEYSHRAIHGKYRKSKKRNFNYILAFINMLYRQTDWDVKDLHIRDLTGKYPHLVNIVKLATRTYLKDIEFDSKLNQFRKELIGMGHLIVKVVDGEPKKVNPLNVIIPPDSKGIQETGMIEVKFKTWEEVQKYKDSPNFQKLKELKKTMDEVGEQYFVVMDYWTYDKFDVGGKEEETKGCIRYVDTSAIFTKNIDNLVPSIEIERFASPHKIPIRSKALRKKLGKKHQRVYPFVEAKFIDVPNRYWGAGVAELLKELNIYSNKILNIKEAFDELQLRGIIVHKKADVVGAKPISQEFTKNLDTGVVVSLEADESLERLNLGSTTFDTLAMLDKLFEIMRIFIGVNQQSTGEHSPSTVTATVGRINDANAKTTYEVIKEVQAIYLTKLFRDFLQEEIVSNLTEEDVVNLTGTTQELRELDRFLVTQQVYRDAHNALIQPTEEEVNAEIERKLNEIQLNGNRFVKIKKELIKDLKFIIEFSVGEHGLERQSRIVNLLEMARDPQYPGSREALYGEIRDLIGLDGFRYEKTAQEKEAEIQAQEAEAIKDAKLSPEQLMGNNIGNQKI